MDSNKQNLINKILYRAQYRGTKEMDIFVSKFVNSIIDDLDHKELVSLDKLPIEIVVKDPGLTFNSFLNDLSSEIISIIFSTSF